MLTPRRKTELKMIEEFLCTLVGRGSGSKASRSSTADSGTSSSPLSLHFGPSPSRSPLTRSGQQTGLVSSGHAAAGLTRTDLEKLPAGFADISPADISLIKELGEGSYGEVWLASYCQTLVAVKIASRARHANLTATLQQQETLRNLRNEASLMATLNHPNICRYLGACLDPPLMVMEYCAKKSLDALLADATVNPELRKELTWDRLLGMVLDAANGMKFLHTRQPAAVAHRDLKSANLLVDASWHVKVSDFGLSRAVDASKAASTVLVTNPRWLAPCVLSGLPGQLAADVWAFGTVMWEVATWQLPFENLNPYQIIALVREQGTDSLQLPPPDQLAAGPFAAPGNYEAYHQLMRDCRAADPNQRPSFAEIVGRLAGIVEQETHARHPEVDLARRSPSAPAETLKTFRLPPDGPAHKSAIAALQRRRSALIQGKPSSGGGAPAATTTVGSAPAASTAGNAPAGVTIPGAAGSAPAAIAIAGGAAQGAVASEAPEGSAGGGATTGSGSAEGGAADAAPAPGGSAGSGAGKAAEAATGAAGGFGQLAVSAAVLAPVAEEAAAAQTVAAAAEEAVLSKVDTGATDAPRSPMPTDAAPLDFTRS
ncbi:hypothetical protein COHA_000265 [Chlorella ohadii]|uniref:Protein kinase domain-containing protein n=1 Tax=Chlorella ohadii TaxID=2649997 RepID=A0AAD5E1A3_9CHLO|nr:hypothetical protein COHA_000265 [Chlorella ohadii]